MDIQEQQSDFIRATKPASMSHAAFAVMVVLMNEAQSGPVWLSEGTLSERTGINRRTVVRAVAELVVTLKWVKKHSGKRRFNSNLYEILRANLPVYVPEKPLVITDQAKRLAKWYQDIYLAHFIVYANKKGRKCRRRLRPDWEKRWSPVFQRVLNAHGYSAVGSTLDGVVRRALDGDKAALQQFVAGPQGITWPEKEGQ